MYGFHDAIAQTARRELDAATELMQQVMHYAMHSF